MLGFMKGSRYISVMKFPFSMFAIAVLFLAGCGKSDSGGASNGNPANAPADYAGALGRSQARAVGTIDLASLKQAINLFNVNEGRYPKDLNELVQSKLISKVPDAPNGKKIVYDPATGNVSIVSE
jgi:hypothetical protein